MNESKKKILVIDDNLDLTKVLVDKFSISGYEAKAANDGIEGLRLAKDFKPDLILLDIAMPKKDGLETLKELRSDEWGKTARVIMLTLLEEPNHIATAIENGVLGYLVKTDHSLENIVKEVQDRF